MKNKKVIIILTSMIALIGCILFASKIYNKFKNKHIPKKNNLAIMVKGESGEYVSSDAIPKGNYILNEDKTICENGGKVVSYNNSTGQIEFSFLGSDRCTLYFDYKEKKGWETILLNNGGKDAIEAKGTPDFTQDATTNEGMYAMEDDLGTSYYFRGTVDNNWIKFGKDLSGKDIYWRIIRINGDGSIRMIYTGTTAPIEDSKVIMTGEDTQIGISAFNSSSYSPEYVGYMYTNGEQHGTSTDSTVKTYIDNWYKTTTLETDASTKALVADGIFCNDRTVTKGTWSTNDSQFTHAPATRSYNRKPALTCLLSDDKFSVSNLNGNGALTYPVGLITTDEFMIASYFSNTNYLYTGQNYWTVSSLGWIEPRTYASWHADGDYGYGYSSSDLDRQYGVRPVINLSANAKLSGDGTYNNVYMVS